MADYLPTTDGDLLIWFNNFRSKFPTYGPTMGFTGFEVTAVGNDYDMLVFVVHAADAVRTESTARARYQGVLRDGPIGTVQPALLTIPLLPVPTTIVAPGIVPRLRATVQRVKAHPAYTESIGTDLGVIGTDTSATANRPIASAMPEPGNAVHIDWTKAGYDGVIVESQRADETVWRDLGTDMQSPYIDTRDPLHAGVPEVRRYRLRYVKSDLPTGDYTDTITVTTTP